MRKPQLLARATRSKFLRPDPASALFLSVVVLAAYIPTYLTLAAGPWQTEQEGHGPLIMLAAAWIAWQCRGKLQGITIVPALAAGWVALLGGLALMVVARSQGILPIEVGSQIPMIAGCVLLLGGWRGLRIFAFPLGLLVFMVPPPGFVIDAITVPLKVSISDAVVHVLHAAGYPIAQNGVMIMIGPYQVLVKDACSGLNSLVALSAIGFLYVYFAGRSSKICNLVLLVATVPIAIAANFVRVMALVLIAYYGGIDAIEGVYHDVTGIALFIVALVLLLLLDGLISTGSAAVRMVRARIAATRPL